MKKTNIVFLFVVGLAAVCAGACSFEAAVPKYVGAAAGVPPELLGVRVSSSSEVNFQFSEPVGVVSVAFDPPAVLDASDGETVVVRFDAPYAVGTKVTADILVSNGDGDTLEAVLTFSAFNDCVPAFQINEIRTEMSKPRVDFIELKMLSAGNLAGVRLFIASNGTNKPVYEFPAVEVDEGEYVTLHRNPDYINGIDELGDNFALSTADDAKAQADCPQNARDLWFADSKEVLRKSDAVYLVDQTDAVVDAVVFCDKAKETEKWGGNPNFISAMEILTAAGAWDGGESGIDGAFDSSGTSPTNTICRRENAADTNTAEDWYKSGSGKASPGKANALP